MKMPIPIAFLLTAILELIYTYFDFNII